MTDLDLVARLAKKAATHTGRDINIHRDWAEAFAALLAEECAKVCEEAVTPGMYGMREHLAAAIRARFVHSPPAASERLAEPGRRSGPDLG